jgi:cytochrome c oxidase subunit 2
MRSINVLFVLLVLLFLAGCGSTTDSAKTTVLEQTTAPTSVAAQTGDVRVIQMTVKNFAFEPSNIQLSKGDKVKLVMNVESGNHGIAIPGFNIEQSLPQGTTQTVEFTADQTGSFNFFCNVPCGPGHKEMIGSIIVS